VTFIDFGYVSTQLRDTASSFRQGVPLKEAAAVIFQKRVYATASCKRNIEMTPLCKIEATLPRVLGSREVRLGGVVDEQAGVQPA
jgi:hypothetical protein